MRGTYALYGGGYVESANKFALFHTVPLVSTADGERIDFAPFSAHPASMGKAKNPAAKAPEEKTPGTIMAEEVRAEANTLTDADRESLMAHAMRTVYGEKSDAAHAVRR